MTRGSQDTRVKIINRELVTMSSLVEKQIYESLLCLKNYDVEKAKQVIKDDDKVDDMQKKIEEECIKYIATEQPLATDLRRVFTASKIVTDLERMADHAVDVCKITKRIGGSISNNKEILEQLMSMESKVRSMLKAAIEAHINEDSELAYKYVKKMMKLMQFINHYFQL
ncbi:phosphate transport system protein [Clostridium saccharoperbutylacetonicum]|nr:phosphate transport system protein [Clostridium saccharoperbutylacetonicum]